MKGMKAFCAPKTKKSGVPLKKLKIGKKKRTGISGMIKHDRSYEENES